MTNIGGDGERESNFPKSENLAGVLCRSIVDFNNKRYNKIEMLGEKRGGEAKRAKIFRETARPDRCV